MIEGRTFLVEGLNYRAVHGELAYLPDQAAVKSLRNADMLAARLPSAPSQKITGSPMHMAKAYTPDNALVIDYYTTLAGTNAGGLRFLSGQTYYINGMVDIKGDTVLEGGSVLKFNPAVNAMLTQWGGTLRTETSPWNPVVLTSMHDDSLWETITNSTGTPFMGINTDWGAYIELNGGSSDLSNVRVTYAARGLFYFNEGQNRVAKAQFVHCRQMEYHDAANFLVSDADSVFSGYGTAGQSEHLTSAHVRTLSAAYLGQMDVSLTNALLVGVTNVGELTLATNAVYFENSDSVLQPVGAGLHYLADFSPYRYVGAQSLSERYTKAAE